MISGDVLITQYVCNISKNIRNIIQSRIYENIILKVMNNSTKVFPGIYSKNGVQDAGECDFYNSITEEKYDAKIIFTNEQCQNISKGNENIEWLKSLLDEISEASKYMKEKNRFKATVFYNTLCRRLKSVERDENAILFIPFPIVSSRNESVWLRFSANIMSIAYEILIEEYPDICDKNIYLIYVNTKNEFVLCKLGTFMEEYIQMENDYIKYFKYCIS